MRGGIGLLAGNARKRKATCISQRDLLSPAGGHRAPAIWGHVHLSTRSAGYQCSAQRSATPSARPQSSATLLGHIASPLSAASAAWSLLFWPREGMRRPMLAPLCRPRLLVAAAARRRGGRRLSARLPAAAPQAASCCDRQPWQALTMLIRPARSPHWWAALPVAARQRSCRPCAASSTWPAAPLTGRRLQPRAPSPSWCSCCAAVVARRCSAPRPTRCRTPSCRRRPHLLPWRRALAARVPHTHLRRLSAGRNSSAAGKCDAPLRTRAC